MSTTPRPSSTASWPPSTLCAATANVARRLLRRRRVKGNVMSQRWAVLVLAVGALLAAAPAQSQSTLRVAPETLSRILDPHFTTSFTTRDLGYLIYDTLFAVDENFEPKPQMVESYTVSPDKLTYLFVLRSGLKW